MTDAAIDGLPLGAADERAARERTELLERIGKTPTCMLITHDAAGHMHIRPMTTQQVEAPGILWMFVSARGHLAQEIAANPQVLLSYAEPGDSAYAAVRGHALLIQNPQKARELWTAIAGAWFPGGPEDPNLALLRITMSSAEAWEPTAGKVVQFLEMASAALTNSVPEDDGTYRRIDF
jgi:general stress protein 26